MPCGFADRGRVDGAGRPARRAAAAARAGQPQQPRPLLQLVRPGRHRPRRGEALSIRQMAEAAIVRFGCGRGACSSPGCRPAARWRRRAGRLSGGVRRRRGGGRAAGGQRRRRALGDDAHGARRHRCRRRGLGGAGARVAPPGCRGRWPRLSIWQGSADRRGGSGQCRRIWKRNGVALHGLGGAPTLDLSPPPGRAPPGLAAMPSSCGPSTAWRTASRWRVPPRTPSCSTPASTPPTEIARVLGAAAGVVRRFHDAQSYVRGRGCEWPLGGQRRFGRRADQRSAIRHRQPSRRTNGASSPARPGAANCRPCRIIVEPCARRDLLFHGQPARPQQRQLVTQVDASKSRARCSAAVAVSYRRLGGVAGPYALHLDAPAGR